MENASKALLIAGAVLVALVLVALGVYLLSGTKDVSNTAGAVQNGTASSVNKTGKGITNALNKL